MKNTCQRKSNREDWINEPRADSRLEERFAEAKNKDSQEQANICKETALALSQLHYSEIE